MDFKPKLWLRVGTFAALGSTAPGLAAPAAAHAPAEPGASARAPAVSWLTRLAQAGSFGGEGGEAGQRGAGATRARPAAEPKAKPKVQRAPVRRRGKTAAQPRFGFGREGGEGGEGGARAPVGGGVGGRGDLPGPGLGGEGGETGEGGVNTRYIFGFTEGADVERDREREIENDAVIRSGKRAGSYAAMSNKTELEYGLTNNTLVAFGSFLSAQRIRNVPGLENADGLNFNGLSGEVKTRFLDRFNQPFGMAISLEPEWNRFSGTSGRREDGYGLEMKLYLDAEVIPNTLFAAVNVLYEPEAARVKETDPATGRFVEWEKESTFGVSGALAYALAPGVFLGGEVRYLAQYSGILLNRFEGDALFAGPTVSWRFAPRALLQAAYSVQVSGKSIDEPARRLNLDAFERRQGRIRAVYEF